MKTAEAIMKQFIPNGVVNVKAKGKGNGMPQYQAEIKAITDAMKAYASQAIDEAANRAKAKKEVRVLKRTLGRTGEIKKIVVDRESILSVKSDLK